MHLIYDFLGYICRLWEKNNRELNISMCKTQFSLSTIPPTNFFHGKFDHLTIIFYSVGRLVYMIFEILSHYMLHGTCGHVRNRTHNILI